MAAKTKRVFEPSSSTHDLNSSMRRSSAFTISPRVTFRGGARTVAPCRFARAHPVAPSSTEKRLRRVLSVGAWSPISVIPSPPRAPPQMVRQDATNSNDVVHLCLRFPEKSPADIADALNDRRRGNEYDEEIVVQSMYHAWAQNRDDRSCIDWLIEHEQHVRRLLPSLEFGWPVASSSGGR